MQQTGITNHFDNKHTLGRLVSWQLLVHRVLKAQDDLWVLYHAGFAPSKITVLGAVEPGRDLAWAGME
jgi:hypothetical protein